MLDVERQVFFIVRGWGHLRSIQGGVFSQDTLGFAAIDASTSVQEVTGALNAKNANLGSPLTYSSGEITFKPQPNQLHEEELGLNEGIINFGFHADVTRVESDGQIVTKEAFIGEQFSDIDGPKDHLNTPSHLM
ncbi:hypothetical protein LIER_00535 [Lithospermum erythrorhizon]|uniref:Uncharacterized protein n=1 Tax=Lithospermum erythrorhizon TaxID=34254 RepID=A0AAV3NHQ1_LITER